MRRTLLLLLLTALMLGVPARVASADGLLLEAAALGALPVGELSGGVSAGDLLDFGYGVRAHALFELRSWLSAGAGVGVTVLGAELRIGDVTHDADLTGIPAYGLLRARTLGTRGWSLFGEVGAGAVAWSLKPDDVATSDSRTQTSFAYLVGTGFALELTEDWDAVAGVSWLQSLTDDGEVWSPDDDPALVLFSLGAQFRR